MGVKVWNQEIVEDYVRNEVYLRFHIDIPLDKKLASEIRKHFESGEFDEIKKKAKKIAEPSAHAAIDSL